MSWAVWYPGIETTQAAVGGGGTAGPLLRGRLIRRGLLLGGVLIRALLILAMLKESAQ